MEKFCYPSAVSPAVIPQPYSIMTSIRVVLEEDRELSVLFDAGVDWIRMARRLKFLYINVRSFISATDPGVAGLALFCIGLSRAQV